MSFFTIVDPAAPSIDRRRFDTSWSTTERLDFTYKTVQALNELHGARTETEYMVHRNLTPKNILVSHGNSPIFVGFDRTKIPADQTVVSIGPPTGNWVAPEVLAQGLGVADKRSDVFSLCACLKLLFKSQEGAEAGKVRAILEGGQSERPEDRAPSAKLAVDLSDLIGDSSLSTPHKPPPAQYWTDGQEVDFRDRKYRIVSVLGSGGVGTAFKVVEIDWQSEEILGTYVAKVTHNAMNGQRVLKSYNLVRSHLGRHAALSTIFEVASGWSENEFIALMTWVEGASLHDFIGVFSLLAEEQGEISGEALAIRWLESMCQALDTLHRNSLVHGDVSPRNMIVSNSDLVLTDYDGVTKIGETAVTPGTLLYSPPRVGNQPSEPADDIYALAASFCHVVFDTKPFVHNETYAKELGLNLEGAEYEDFPIFTKFLQKATDPRPEERYRSAAEALRWLSSPSQDIGAIVQTEEEGHRTENQVDWLRNLLQAYPGSQWGNRETRGLDTEFSSKTYVTTVLENSLYEDISERRSRLVILCGNAGDGKTALLQHLAGRLGVEKSTSARRILKGIRSDGMVVRMNLDGSASWGDRTADELLNDFLEPFQQGPPEQDLVHLLAINDGRLLEWIENMDESTPLTEELHARLENGSSSQDGHIQLIDLNQRTLVGSVTVARDDIETYFLDHLLDSLYGGKEASEIWAACRTCSAQERCEVFRAMGIFGPDGVPGAKGPPVRSRARKRLSQALQAVHLRGETHITIRELRATLIYILFGIHFCQDYHEMVDAIPYWERAFSPETPNRQGEVLRELIRFDPALDSHPRIDRHLMRSVNSRSARKAPSYNELSLPAARRRAYFEWSEDDILEITGGPNEFDLAQGKNLEYFRRLSLKESSRETDGVLRRLCQGISRLEGLPPQALARANVVPLRIIPRTPTETVFWVEKPLESFSIEPDIPSFGTGLESLHRQAYLNYRYKNGGLEPLRLGAELFHLLLELGNGYQLGDVSTSEILTHLSIFVQRLLREDERSLFAWSPMQEEMIFTVAAEIQETEKGFLQVLSIIDSGKGLEQ